MFPRQWVLPNSFVSVNICFLFVPHLSRNFYLFIIIALDPDSGIIEAISDPRKDGIPSGI
jgi:hypothetical protein